jgi:hypothetical protein
MLVAAAFAFGAGQASEAATTPAAGWHSYTPPGGGGSLLDMYAPSAGDAWAVGQTDTGGSLYMHFNGTAWSAVSGPDIGPVSAINGTSDSDLWVLGATSSATYNGSAWTTYPLAIPAGSTGGGFILGLASNDVFAANSSDAYADVDVLTGSAVQQILEHFNGTEWSIVTDAPNISVGGSNVNQVTGSGPDDVYVSANYNNDSKSEVVHFNGTSWSVESMPGSPFGVDVSVTGAGQALALGADSSGTSYAAELSDGTWTTISLPFSGAEPLDPTSGTGTVWSQMLTPAGSDGPTTLWQWSGGRWTQIKPNDLLVGGPIGAADGSGLWSFTPGGSVSGGAAAETELYVG